MANMREHERTGLVQNREESDPCNCGESFQNKYRQISKTFFGFATLAALTLSIFAIVLATRENTKLNQSENELDSIRQEIKTCWNHSYDKIQELARKIDEIEASIQDLIIQTKSTLENRIITVKSSLNTRIISVQNQVSDLNTNVNEVETGLGSFEGSTNSQFSKVWEKFKAIDKEIANLPKNSGSLGYMKNHVVLYCFIVVIYVLHLV